MCIYSYCDVCQFVIERVLAREWDLVIDSVTQLVSA